MYTASLREKTVTQLRDELAVLRKERFKLRMQLSSQQTQKTHQMREVRKNIARVKTVLTEKMGETL